jgi:hypothetical protein
MSWTHGRSAIYGIPKEIMGLPRYLISDSVSQSVQITKATAGNETRLSLCGYYCIATLCDDRLF